MSTVNGAITQAGAVSVGAVAGTQTATLNAGTADITLANAGNNFDRVALTGNVVTLKDANIITLGNSTVGSLGLRVGGQPSTTAISTDGALVTSGDVSLESTSSYASGISIANGSSIGGVFSAATFGGSVSVVASGNSTTGNLTVGNITNTVSVAAGTSQVGKQIDQAGFSTSTPWTVPTASSVAAVDGKLPTTAITVSNPQLAPIYASSGPTITVQSPTASAPVIPDAKATGTAAVPAALGTGLIAVSAGGFNYDLATTTVSIIGGGGVGAQAVPVINGNGQITDINITNGGAGFISKPTIIISSTKDANTVAATASPVMDAQGRLVGATIVNQGAGYSNAVAPTVTISAAVNTGGTVSINTTSNLVTVGTGLGATAGISTSGINSDRAVTLRGAAVETQGNLNIPNTAGLSAAAATITSTAGGILFNSTVAVPRLAVTATGGNITQNGTNGMLTTANTTVSSSFSAIGNDILLNTSKQAAGATTLAGQNSLSGTGLVLAGNNVTIGSNQTLVVTSSNVTNNLTVQSGPTRNIVLGNGTGSDATHVVVGGVLTAAAGSTGTITDNNDSNITATGGMVLSSGSGAITIDGPSIPGALTSTIRAGSVSASTSGHVTIAETSTLNLGNIGNSTTAVASLTAISTTGSIVDSGNIYATTASFKVSGNNNIVLDNGFVAANALAVPPTAAVESKIGTISIDGGVDNSITNLNSDVTIAAINNATGTTTVSTAGGIATNNGRITLGSISTGNLSVNSAGGFIDVAGNVVISGNLSMTAGGVVPSATTFGDIYDARATIDNAKGTLTGLAIASSSLNAVAANRSGMLTYAVAPTVAISGGGITGSTPNPAGIVTATLNATTGQLTGFNVTNSALTGTTTPYNSTAGATTAVTATITGATNTSIVQTTGALKVAGTTTITTNGTANLYRNNDFNDVVLANSTGNAIISDVNSVNVSGTTAGMIDVRAGVNGVVATNVDTDDRKIEAGTWGVNLGNISAGSLYVSASNGGAGNTGRIAQTTGSTIFSFGTSSFTTSNNSITVANAGNSFGRVQLSSGGGNITFVEDGSIRLGSLSSGNATVSLTSRSGSIIEDNSAGAANTALTTGAAGNVTLSAANGSILLGNTTQTVQSTTGAFTARVNASAPAGQVALISSGNLSLGTIDANSLTVTTTGTTGEITQAAAAKVYGTTSFTAASGNIAVTNTGNNFGRVFVTGNAGISIVENGTLNLGRVTMPAAATGNFSATSVNGDIIDTGLSNVRPGGTVIAGGAGVGTGVVSLTASNGNITLDDPTTEFPTSGGVVFNAKNVTLAPLGGATLVLGAANQTASAANLTVTSATGSIGNAGAVKVSGDASFQTGTGNIDLTNSGNAFGSVRFAGAVVSITEADDIALASGSSATGAATFNSVGGSISIVNKGGTINLNSTGLFTASGNITLAKLIQANGTITVSAPGTKDLSALSLAGDLAGKAPTNIGTGTYLPPSP